MLSVLARFSRPHTVFATTIQAVSLFLIAGGRFSLANVGLVLFTLLVCLALNSYVVGLNQITDIEIDRINKPRLPLASAEMSLPRGWFMVGITGLTAFIGALMAGPFLLVTILLIMIIGTVYSLPPLRLKQHPVWAAVSIALARGVIANVGVTLHYQYTLAGSLAISPLTLAIMAAFFFGFGLVIAIYKDIPDLLGDQMHGIRSFTVRLGPERAFDLGRLILTLGYLGLITVALLRLPQPDGILLLAAQATALLLFWIVSSRVDPRQKSSIARFYMFLWGLFYAQYIILSLYQMTRGFV